MSSSKLSETAGPPAGLLPPPRGPGRLAEAVREAAQKQKLTSRVARRYQAWIFLFVSWCLKAPPHRMSEARIGDFWDALSNRGLSRAQICHAMDALALLFGAVDEPERHLYPDGPPERAPGRPDSVAQHDPWHSPGSSADYLPDGTLPPSADPRAVVPTRGTGRAGEPKAVHEKAVPEERSASTGPPQTFWEAAERISSVHEISSAHDSSAGGGDGP